MPRAVESQSGCHGSKVPCRPDLMKWSIFGFLVNTMAFYSKLLFSLRQLWWWDLNSFLDPQSCTLNCLPSNLTTLSHWWIISIDSLCQRDILLRLSKANWHTLLSDWVEDLGMKPKHRKWDKENRKTEKRFILRWNGQIYWCSEELDSRSLLEAGINQDGPTFMKAWEELFIWVTWQRYVHAFNCED